MPNVFRPAMNTVFPAGIIASLGLVCGAVGFLWIIVRMPYMTRAGVIREQPIPFSHKHHVGDAGIDCRYCHTSVEDSSFAGLPSTDICMNCHAYLFSDQPMLAPVRDSLRTGQPLRWLRIHDVPDFAKFDHSIHVRKGVACETCHGPVDRMPLMWRQNTLLMSWCIDCHRNPTPNLRPREFVFRPEPLETLAETHLFRRYLQAEWPEINADSPDLATLQTGLAERYRVQSRLNRSLCHY